MGTTDKSLSDIYAEYQKGDLSEAENDCLNILDNHPANAEAHYILGLVLLKKGDAENALKRLSRVIEIDPGLAEAHYLSGVIQQGAGDLDAALAAYKNALKARPEYPEASCNLGAIFHALGQPDNAAACYKDALSFAPGNLQIEYNLARTYQANKQLELAAEHFLKILELEPGFLEARFNLGLTLYAQGRVSNALKHFMQILALKPDHTGALNNCGNIYMQQCLYDSAITAFEQALSQEPDNPQIHFNLGLCLKEDGQFSSATYCFRKALALDPAFAKATAELYRCNQTLCDWRNHAHATGELIEITRTCLQNSDVSPVYPFDSLSLPFTPETLREIAASHANIISRNAGAGGRHFIKYRHPGGTQLRIGYVSQKFNNHAGAHLIASLFGLHDRSQFQLFAYSIGENDHSIYRQRIEQSCENFIDVSGENFTGVAQRINDDGIDILIDLGVYNTHSLTEIFALHPAPVQVSYLGYPGTSGASFYDYIITDRTVTPPDQQKWFSEKFAYLPHCYQVNDDRLELLKDIPPRSTCRLPEKAFVFCSFNNSYKIEPVMFDVWMNILARIPESVLWLLDHNPEAKANLRREATARGIDSKRLVFAEKLPKDFHLARHRHADLFLDTRLYNAHTTASDSLRVGVPVLTMPGTTFASRVAASLLSTVNLPEMIATNLDEYADISIEYSTNKRFSEKIQRKLSTNINSTPLFNTPLYARHLESAFRQMWDIYTSGAKPQQIVVTPIEQAFPGHNRLDKPC